MKKNVQLQTGLLIVLALVAGFFLGLFVQSPMTADRSELTGSVGKVDRYRNVKVTDDDILLRNELVDDTAKCKQYEKYLLYYYYQAIRTGNDLDKVLQKTAAVDAFNQTYADYADALVTYKDFLKTAQIDILAALNMIVSLKDNAEVPVISYLNQAQNAISRIRNDNALLINFTGAIDAFIADHPETNFPVLDDVHDILAINLMQAAIVTQNKPVLTYVHRTRLKSDRKNLTELIGEEQFNAVMNDHLVNDMQTLGIFDAAGLQDIVLTDMDKLNVIFNAEQLGVIYDVENLGVLDVEQLGSIADVEQLGDFLNAEQLGVIFDMQQLNAQ